MNTAYYDYTVTERGGKVITEETQVRREAVLRAFKELQPGQQLHR